MSIIFSSFFFIAKNRMDTEWLNSRSEGYSDDAPGDLCSLTQLDEESVLQTLKTRFDNGDIYSYAGNCLIAVNPYKFYPIYNPKVR